MKFLGVWDLWIVGRMHARLGPSTRSISFEGLGFRIVGVFVGLGFQDLGLGGEGGGHFKKKQ